MIVTCAITFIITDKNVMLKSNGEINSHDNRFLNVNDLTMRNDE